MSPKQKQYIGDAVFTLIAREYFSMLMEDLEDKYHHSMVNSLVSRMCSNVMMGLMAVELNIINIQDVHNSLKCGGNEFEEYVYVLYEKNGILFMKKWLKESIVPIFNKLHLKYKTNVNPWKIKQQH